MIEQIGNRIMEIQKELKVLREKADKMFKELDHTDTHGKLGQAMYDLKVIQTQIMDLKIEGEAFLTLQRLDRYNPIHQGAKEAMERIKNEA